MEGLKLAEIERRANKYRLQNYGNLVMSDPPIKEENEWIFNLKSAYPKIVVDDGDPPIRELFFINLNNIGKLVYNFDGRLLDSTSRGKIIDRIDDFLNVWEKRVEKIIIKACSNNLVFSSTIAHFLTPLRKIISTITFMGRISNIELNKFPNIDRAYEWVTILESENILEKTDYGYKYGSMWSTLYDRANKIKDDERDEFHQIIKNNIISFTRDTIVHYIIISYVFQEHYSFIKEMMRLKGINRVLNINNLYYKPCIQAEKLLTFKPKTILYNYQKFYSNIEFSGISNSIWELVTIGLLEYKNDKIIGNEERFEKMLELEPSKSVSLPLTDFV